jgi:MFS family permease
MLLELVKNWKVHVFAIAIAVLSESIGTFKYHLIVMFPMLYAMLMGSVVSFPRFKILNESQTKHAGMILGVMIVLQLSKLGTVIGPQIPYLMQAKLALMLQEIGHFVGTILLGLPLAVMLGMNRESIGATYSIDREPSIAIIFEKYGPESPEGRGVMAMYICGTIFGALWIAILSGVLAQLGVLHPYALAMGAGVGSGAMMTASMGAIAEVYPAMKDQIFAYAGAANLMTTALGVWIALYVSLPIAVWAYGVLNGLRGRKEQTK